MLDYLRSYLFNKSCEKVMFVKQKSCESIQVTNNAVVILKTTSWLNKTLNYIFNLLNLKNVMLHETLSQASPSRDSRKDRIIALQYGDRWVQYKHRDRNRNNSQCQERQVKKKKRLRKKQ